MTASNVLDRATAFADKFVAHQAQAWEAAGTVGERYMRDAAAQKLTALLVPRAHGGEGVLADTLVAVLARIAAVDFAAAFSLVVHNNLAAAIARLAPQALRDRYLPQMVSGERVGAFLLTEPQGGSDAAAIAATARRSGDGYVLNGDKAWVTNARSAGLLSVYAQAPGGMIAFLVPRESDGVEATDAYALLGGHALGAGGFRFKNVHVREDHVLVPEGKGLQAALEGIDLARLCVAGMCCGMMRASLDYALQHAESRRFKGRPVTEQQGFAVAARRRGDRPGRW